MTTVQLNTERSFLSFHMLKEEDVWGEMGISIEYNESMDIFCVVYI
jgi:hypothetical protein